MSQRRVQQIIKQYKETGLEPVLGEIIGRPFKPYDEQESEIVREAHVRYRFGARMLEVVIRKQYKIRISHNRIHMYYPSPSILFLNTINAYYFCVYPLNTAKFYV